MSGLFNRVWSLRAGKAGCEGLRWSSPTRIVFEVLLSGKPRENKATVSLFNISPASIGQLDEDDAIITLNAGFDALSGLIFTGSIARRGVNTLRSDMQNMATATARDGASFITTIEAGEAELALQDTRVSKSFSRNSKNIEIFESIAGDIGVSLAETDQIKALTYSGGWVYQGKASQALDALVRDINASWSIQAGQLLILTGDQTTRDEAYVISPDSGLIGIPAASKDGIELTSLLLSPLRPGRKIRVQSETALGTFKIDEVTHKGDSRGAEWVSKIKAKRL